MLFLRQLMRSSGTLGLLSNRCVRTTTSKERSYWKEHSHRQKYLKSLAETIGISRWEDWYKVTSKDFISNGGRSFLNYYDRNIVEAIESNFEGHPWIRSRFKVIARHRRSRLNSTNAVFSKPQRMLEQILQEELGSDTEVIANYKHFGLIHASGKPMELDLWIPKYEVAVEYNGEQHYQQLPHSTEKTYRQQQRRDEEKITACKAFGIDLVIIPFWWSGSKYQVLSSIHKVRPDVAFKSSLKTLKFEEFSRSEPKGRSIELADMPPESLSIAQSFMDAERWRPNFFPQNWLLSEKIDGIRFLWTGKGLYSRRGLAIPCPPSISDQLPRDMQLEGDLWITRNARFRSKDVLRSHDWNNMKIMVSDAPKLDKPYIDRLEILRSRFPPDHKTIQVVETKSSSSAEMIMESFVDVINRQGFGLILRDPSARYVAGKSAASLLITPQYLSVAKVDRQEGHYVVVTDFGKTFLVRAVVPLRDSLERGANHITYAFDTFLPSGIPFAPQAVAVHSDITKVLKYFVSFGSDLKFLERNPKCAGCHRSFDQNEPRISVKGTLIQSIKNPFFRTFSFCLRTFEHCLQLSWSIYQGTAVTVPTFHGQIGIPHDCTNVSSVHDGTVTYIKQNGYILVDSKMYNLTNHT
eukprot:TRINITY_DN8047_c0_g1_i1.p1 TRINITY_DN8047_c0_g1~~TRINITY_DN8047_c0_g1_i1.p1  ORF type:complete len:636 (-),score=14.49 TRINITY_DN8047_c0_g1_i1:53-1960(-)